MTENSNFIVVKNHIFYQDLQYFYSEASTKGFQTTGEAYQPTAKKYPALQKI
jgi:hypothetical protein